MINNALPTTVTNISTGETLGAPGLSPFDAVIAAGKPFTMSLAMAVAKFEREVTVDRYHCTFNGWKSRHYTPLMPTEEGVYSAPVTRLPPE